MFSRRISSGRRGDRGEVGFPSAINLQISCLAVIFSSLFLPSVCFSPPPSLSPLSVDVSYTKVNVSRKDYRMSNSSVEVNSSYLVSWDVGGD